MDKLTAETIALVLLRGGTAVDAAIAANAVLCVAYPHMAGLGGDSFWLIADEKTNRVHGLNASGHAAQLAMLDYYRSKAADNEIPSRGPLAILTVPGAVDGWRAAHERFGACPGVNYLKRRLLMPATVYRLAALCLIGSCRMCRF